MNRGKPHATEVFWAALGSYGATTHSTRPLGSKHAGASFAPVTRPATTTGKSGPALQVPGWFAIGGGVYSAVWLVAPMQNTRPSGSASAEPASSEGASTSVTGVLPLDTQVSAAMMYFSVRGLPSHSI